MFDVGGSQAHRNSRHVFYNNIAGVILVHDLSNRKSQRNLDRCSTECILLIKFVIFYNSLGTKKVDTGVIAFFVHDFSKGAFKILNFRWLREYLDRESGNGKARESFWDDPGGGNGSGTGSTGDLRALGGVDVNVPLLVVGTKHDLAVAGTSLPTHQGRARTTGSVPKFTRNEMR